LIYPSASSKITHPFNRDLRLIKPNRNLMLYLFQLTLLTLLTIVLALVTILIGIFDRFGKHAYSINRLWTWLILRIGGVSLQVDGLQHIDPSRQYIFIVNHQSNIDIPVLVQALAKFQLRWLAKKELLHVPFFGWAMWATKHVTVDRADPQDFSGDLSGRHAEQGRQLTEIQKGRISTRGPNQNPGRPSNGKR